MDYLDFLFCLKGVAIRTDLRLFHNIPPAGCGWMFYFKDDKTGRYSDYYYWSEKHETPQELFVNLVSFGEKFKESLKEESAE